jgi:hypothetical protein
LTYLQPVGYLDVMHMIIIINEKKKT